MRWDKEAMEDLKYYNRRRESLSNVEERAAALKAHFESVKCGLSSDSVPTSGGAPKIEDRMLNNIVERKRLALTYKATKKLVELTEAGLAGLDAQERRVLELFYISPAKGNVDRLCNELGYEQRQIYNIKNDALYKFVICQYGIFDY